MVYCVFKSGMVRSQPKIDESRFLKNYDKQSFIRDLKQVPWHVASNDTIDDCVNIWNKLFLELIADCSILFP
jgi:hypothetical protein